MYAHECGDRVCMRVSARNVKNSVSYANVEGVGVSVLVCVCVRVCMCVCVYV